MNMVSTGANRRGESNATWIVGIERLHHPDTPESINSVRTIDVFAAGRRIEHVLAAADEIELTTEVSDPRGAVPNNIDAAVIAGVDPGKNVIVQHTIGRAGSVDLARRAPRVSLIGR